MVSALPEAFILLSLPNTTLKGAGISESGILGLECVTIHHPESANAQDRDVYLVLRLNQSETPLDPARVVRRIDGPGIRTYTFAGTQSDPSQLVLTVRVPPPGNLQLADNLETFESILDQYVVDFQGPPGTTAPPPPVPSSSAPSPGLGFTNAKRDLRGHLVMINQETGEVVGEVEDRFRIREDPVIHEKGHENDPVFIEVAEGSTREADANALEAFARLVPPDQQNWMTKSANIVSHAISMTTSLLVTTISTGAGYYVSHSTPSPHNSAARTPSGSRGPSPGPPPLPPRALVFLTSEKTRKGLSTVHAISGEAVKVSSKTINLIDSMIRRAMGAKPRRQKYFPHGGPAIGFLSPTQTGPPFPPRSPSPSTSSLAPPPYTPGEKGSGPSRDYRPASPGRGPTSPGPPLPARTQPGPPMGAEFPQPRLTTKDRILISADLVLSTIDHSTRRILDAGTEELGRVVGHRYGAEAAQSSLLMAGTARNVGLVYVDMRGIGRRALLRRAGRTFVKSTVSNNMSGNQARPPAVPFKQ